MEGAAVAGRNVSNVSTTAWSALPVGSNWTMHGPNVHVRAGMERGRGRKKGENVV